ncbi:hypothetical protein CHBEV_040 [Choristoneura biennis entomopoxvirus]|uniref:Uncharacterized protein n=1 Tax=Choristoneura biennis entomopoxvirus TaxID=10288 RepID=A0A916KPD0_CBEPV|nr:hypothetical protein CHBEV_040 [Choristoneura biennis entomopoxvirus]CCU55608.1 hypothetical protein CHBEV_040 [Choristoneura biennis entomopoxvirus]
MVESIIQKSEVAIIEQNNYIDIIFNKIFNDFKIFSITEFVDKNLEELNKNLNNKDCEHFQILRILHSGKNLFERVSNYLSRDQYNSLINLLILENMLLYDKYQEIIINSEKLNKLLITIVKNNT